MCKTIKRLFTDRQVKKILPKVISKAEECFPTYKINWEVDRYYLLD